MGASKRVRIDPTDDWQQLRLRVRFPEQETYELLRPSVLFGRTAAERAEATGVADRTLDRKADRFDAEGMAGRFPTRARADWSRRRVPAERRHRILAPKAEYPPFRPREIAAICRRRDDCRVGHKTVRRVLAEGSLRDRTTATPDCTHGSSMFWRGVSAPHPPGSSSTGIGHRAARRERRPVRTVVVIGSGSCGASRPGVARGRVGRHPSWRRRRGAAGRRRAPRAARGWPWTGIGRCGSS